MPGAGGWAVSSLYGRWSGHSQKISPPNHNQGLGLGLWWNSPGAPSVGMPNGRNAERIFGQNADSYCPISGGILKIGVSTEQKWKCVIGKSDINIKMRGTFYAWFYETLDSNCFKAYKGFPTTTKVLSINQDFDKPKRFKLVSVQFVAKSKCLWLCSWTSAFIKFWEIYFVSITKPKSMGPYDDTKIESFRFTSNLHVSSTIRIVFSFTYLLYLFAALTILTDVVVLSAFCRAPHRHHTPAERHVAWQMM